MNPPPRYRVEQSGPDAFRVYDTERSDSQLRGLTLPQAWAMADALNRALSAATEIERECEMVIQRSER